MQKKFGWIYFVHVSESTSHGIPIEMDLFCQEMFVVVVLNVVSVWFQCLSARPLQLKLSSAAGRVPRCHIMSQVELSEEAKRAWQLEQLHR